MEPWATACGRIHGPIPDEWHCAQSGLALEIMRFVMNKLKFPYQLVRYNETVICMRFLWRVGFDEHTKSFDVSECQREGSTFFIAGLWRPRRQQHRLRRLPRRCATRGGEHFHGALHTTSATSAVLRLLHSMVHKRVHYRYWQNYVNRGLKKITPLPLSFCLGPSYELDALPCGMKFLSLVE